MVVQNQGALEQVVDERGEALAAVATDSVSAQGVDGDHEDVLCPPICEQRCPAFPVGLSDACALAGLQQPRLTNSAAGEKDEQRKKGSGHKHRASLTR